MSYQFPPDIERRLQAHLASGDFPTQDDLLRKAIDSSEQRLDDLASIRRGFDDELAGRWQPATPT